jgi:hypothetical protein
MLTYADAQFVTALRKLISEFGNIDEKFLASVDIIAKESETGSLRPHALAP